MLSAVLGEFAGGGKHQSAMALALRRQTRHSNA
jgi:hypothetical protein